jgi:HEAT repeat protein
MSKLIFIAILAILVIVNTSHAQESSIDGIDARSNPSDFAKQLNSSDPLVRQRSAEALARLAATDQRKLVEGYQLQEKNKEVRLALDWALYRMGHAEALYRIVGALDSGRQEQAIGYLSELESPDVLYPFLKRDNNAPRINAGLLKALARTGDAQTLERDQTISRITPNVRRRSCRNRARRD